MNIKDQVFQAIAGKSGASVSALKFLNSPSAPNSWTVLDKNKKEVWKIITPKALKFKDKFHDFLEKEAIDQIRSNKGIVSYIREGEIRVGRKNGLPFLVFPFIDGIPLDKEILRRSKQGKTFSDSEIKKVAKCLVEAIKTMYEHNVIHQDIKPGNIMLMGDGNVVVLDLGIARFVNENLSLIKRMKGPYAYLSPEKLDMIADLSDFNKRKTSFPSDLFSVGMVVYEMDTLKKLIDVVGQPGEIRKAHLKPKELGVRESLRDIIKGLLNENPLERQLWSSDYYKIAWFSDAPKPQADLWIQHSIGFKFIEEFLQTQDFKSKFGVILAGDQIVTEPPAIERSRFIKKHGGVVAIDPAVFRLSFDFEHHGYLTNRDYGHVVSPNDFLKNALRKRGEEFVSSVLDFQRKCEADILIAPYFVIDRLSDKWFDASFKIWEMTKKKVSKFSQPVYFGLMLSERLMCDDVELDSVISQILFDPSIDNLYLRVENDRQGSESNENEVFIRNLIRLIKSLSPTKNILLSFAGLEVFGYQGFGLSSFGINPDYTKRKQKIIDKFSKPKKDIRIPYKRRRYFAQQLWNDIMAEVELLNKQARALGSKKVLGCKCPYCFKKGKDRRLDTDESRKHFLYHVDKFTAGLQGLSSEKKLEMFSKRLDMAESGYKY